MNYDFLCRQGFGSSRNVGNGLWRTGLSLFIVPFLLLSVLLFFFTPYSYVWEMKDPPSLSLYFSL